MSADIERWDPPNDPTAFESLCLDLWKEIWNGQAQKNGRTGQPQAGVDIFGQHQGKWVGVQCKQKDGLLRRRVTITELEQEMAAAKLFTPPLSTFILATTSPRDAALQKRARELTEQHREQGLFAVEIWSWDDIWPELYGREQLFKRIATSYWPCAETLRRLAPSKPPFDLTLYRKVLSEQYGLLKLGSIADDWNKYTLRLRSVYIPQKVKEALPSREFTRDYLRTSDERRLGFDQTPEDEARRRENLKRQDKEYVVTPSRPLTELVDDPACGRMVILGDPGLGKTTLLQYLALRWAETGQGPIPFLIELRRYASDPGACQDFVQYLEQGHWTPWRFGSLELAAYLKAEASLLLFDGLDEIVDRAHRAMVVSEIIRFAAEYPRARVVVTTRVVGYHPGSKHPESFRNAGFRQFTLQDFEEEEIEKFTTAWHTTAFPTDDDERQLFERRLRRAVRDSSAIRELAGNPLLLTIMAILSRKQDLPRERPRLYHKCGELLLHDWETDKFLDALDKIGPEEKWLMLRHVALAMQAEETGVAGNVIPGDRLKAILVKQLRELGVAEPRDIARDLIQKFHERNFMLSFLGDDWYAFVHRSFLEYLCALEYQCRFEKTSGFTIGHLGTLFTERWRQSEWHEILRLICGLIGTEYAIQLVQRLLDQKGQTDGWQAVFLAADCLSEIRGVDAVRTIKDTVLGELKTVAIFDMPYSYRIARGAPSLATIMSGAIAHIARLWKDDETLRWLLERAVRVPWPARYTVVQELSAARKEDLRMLEWLKERAVADDHHSVRQVATQEVARTWKDHPDTFPWLLQRATDNDPNLRYVAVQELAKGWHDDKAFETLKKAAYDKNDAVREAGVTSLARYFGRHTDTLTILKHCARQDRNYHVREAAIEELTSGWSIEPEVHDIIQESNWWTRKKHRVPESNASQTRRDVSVQSAGLSEYWVSVS